MREYLGWYVLSAYADNSTVSDWLLEFGLQDQATAVEAYLTAYSVDGLSSLRRTDVGELTAMLPEMNVTARAALQASLTALQATPGAVEDLLSGLSLTNTTSAVLAFLESSMGPVATVDLDGLYDVDIDALLTHLQLDVSSNTKLRAALTTLQAGPRTVEKWLAANGLAEEIEVVEEYLAQAATSLEAIQTMPSQLFDSMLDTLGGVDFDASLKKDFKSAMFALTHTATGLVGSGVDELLRDSRWASEAAQASTTRWLSKLESQLCLYQEDQVCDEPWRCPLFTDTTDCNADQRGENVMGAYSAFLRRKTSPQLASIATAISSNYHATCPYTRPVEQCGGCNRSAQTNVLTQGCAPGLPGFPTETELCQRVQSSQQLHGVNMWCDALMQDPWDVSHVVFGRGDKPPCECLVLWQHFLPEGAMWLSVWAVLWLLISVPLTVLWWLRARAAVQLGVIGIDTSQPNNLASVRVIRNRMTEIAPLLLRHKLGRHLRQTVLRTWRRSVMASKEELTLFRDHLKLEAINKFPFCCKCCQRTHTVDEYHVLLKDVSILLQCPSTRSFVLTLVVADPFHRDWHRYGSIFAVGWQVLPDHRPRLPPLRIPRDVSCAV